MSSIIETILDASKSDLELATLVDETRGYAEMYLLAQKTQRGCDGMGELATLKEEFRDVFNKVIQYTQEKKYISEFILFDIDSIADKIVKSQ